MYDKFALCSIQTHFHCQPIFIVNKCLFVFFFMLQIASGLHIFFKDPAPGVSYLLSRTLGGCSLYV